MRMDRERTIQHLFVRTNIHLDQPFRDGIFREELTKLEKRYSILLQLHKELEEDKNLMLRYVQQRRIN